MNSPLWPSTLFGVLLWLLMAVSAGAQEPSPPVTKTNGVPAHFDTNRIAAVDAHIRNYMRENRIPGVAISVVHGTNLVFAKGYGDGITPQTPFKRASVSKSFTALAVMQPVEPGKLDLDAPVRTYLPWFRTADEVESGKILLAAAGQTFACTPVSTPTKSTSRVAAASWSRIQRNMTFNSTGPIKSSRSCATWPELCANGCRLLPVKVCLSREAQTPRRLATP